MYTHNYDNAKMPPRKRHSQHRFSNSSQFAVYRHLAFPCTDHIFCRQSPIQQQFSLKLLWSIIHTTALQHYLSYFVLFKNIATF